MDDCSPLRETSPHRSVLRSTITKSIETLCDELAGRTSKTLRAAINLDAGKDALGCKKFREWCAIRGPLTDGLVLQNPAAYEFSDSRRGKKHLPIGAPALFRRFNPERVKS